MPRYKNKTNVTQIASGVKFDPNEEKDVNCYLYDKNLELIANEPHPVVITHSGTFELMTDAEEEIDLTETIMEECLLDVIVQAPEGGIILYHNDKTNLPMVFEGVYQDQISSKFLQKIIIKATADDVKGSYFVKKAG